MTCREIADFLADYLAGRLAPDVHAEFERHLAVCPNCERYLATYRATIELGRRAFVDLDADADTEVPPEFLRAILNNVK
jgi:anti-sigma factor RsiW